MEKTKDSQRCVIHNTIERRRRQKYNEIFNKLQEIVRKLTNTSEVPSKTETLKFIQNLLSKEEEASQLTNELKFNQLIHQVCNEFIILINCETGLIIYATDNIKNVLGFNNSEIVGKDIFQFLHFNDFGNVKKQLTVEIEDNTSLIHHANSLLNYKSSQSNELKNRRAFICKMKNKQNIDSYSTVAFTGHIQSQSERSLNNQIVRTNYLLATIQLLKKEQDLNDSDEQVSSSSQNEYYLPQTRKAALSTSGRIDRFIKKAVPEDIDIFEIPTITENLSQAESNNSYNSSHDEYQKQSSVTDDEEEEEEDESQNISFHELLDFNWQ